MATRFLSSRPTLGVRSVTSSIEFYRKALGFAVETSMGDPPNFAILTRDGASLALFQVENPALADFASTYWNVKGVEELHARCVEAGAKITHPLTRHEWGNYDFVLCDPDGHQMALGEVPSRS